MTNRFFAGQTDYIEQLNAIDVLGSAGAHIADTTGAHAATAISNTPAGNIAATTVQAAINELDTEKLSASATTLPSSFVNASLNSIVPYGGGGLDVIGNITARLPDTSHSTHRGLKFGVTLYGEDYGGVTMRTDSGEVRYTAGYSGWGGFHTWYCNGVKAMELTSGGSTYNITGTYGAISDAKLKRGVTNTGPKLSKILAMRIVNYFLIADPTNTKLLGMIAQELREISPGLVDETPDYADVVVTPARVGVVNGETVNVPAKIESRPTGTTTLSIKYSVLVPMLIKALQEMHAEFDSRLQAIGA